MEVLALDHFGWDELRWDLAQAYLCTGRSEEAKHLLAQIARNEAPLEYKRYTHDNLLDAKCMLGTLPQLI